MKLNDKFSVCTVAENSFIVPIGIKVMDMRNMLDLNEQATFIINLIKENEMTFDEIVEKLFAEYEMDKETIKTDLKNFLEKGKMVGFITD